MVSFEAAKLLIQESYEVKRKDMFKVAKHPNLTLSEATQAFDERREGEREEGSSHQIEHISFSISAISAESPPPVVRVFCSKLPRLRFKQHAYAHKKAKRSGEAERSGDGGFGGPLRQRYNTTRPRAQQAKRSGEGAFLRL